MKRRDYDRDPVTHVVDVLTATRSRSRCGANNPRPRTGPITCKTCLRITPPLEVFAQEAGIPLHVMHALLQADRESTFNERSLATLLDSRPASVRHVIRHMSRLGLAKPYGPFNAWELTPHGRMMAAVAPKDRRPARASTKLNDHEGDCDCMSCRPWTS